MRYRYPIMAVLVAMVMGGLVGCQFILDLPKTGLLLIIDSENMESMTVTPEVVMEITSYDIKGSGPDEASFSDTGITDNIYERSNLPAGEWTITVDGKNSSGIVIASKSEAVLIVDGQTTTVNVTLVPLGGEGTLAVNLSWPVGEIDNPVVVATLTDSGGVSSAMDFIVTSENASYLSDSLLAAGYYTMAIQLKDSSVLMWGRVVAVRMLAGHTTSATYALVEALTVS